jgi:beta-lactamase regulating signal transducer with metallopeptidase domain
MGGRLLVGSVQALFMIALVWIVCWRIKTMPASLRAFLWWLVSLKLVISLLPFPSMPLPMLPAESNLGTAIVGSTDAPLPASSHAVAALAPPRELSPAAAPDASPRIVRFAVVLAVGAWVAGLLVHAFSLLVAYARLRRVVRRSTPLDTDDALAADRLARVLGLQITPPIRRSNDVDTPLAAGFFRATVLLPASAMNGLSSGEREMAICHEFAHVRRRDLVLGWVPALAERLFFFHPLARLAAREYAADREAACDAVVLRAMDVAPQDYGRMLVRLGVVGVNPVFTMGGSSPSTSSLRRRLDMLQHVPFARVPRNWIALLALVATLAVVPLRVVARTPATPQGAAAPAVPAAARTPAKPVAKPQPAAPAVPAAPRPVARQNAPNGAGIEQSIAEQRRKMQQIEEALSKLRFELQALYEQEQASRLAQERRQVESIRRAVEASQSAERLQESAVRESEPQATKQFLENRLRELMVEQESMNNKQRQIEAEIKELRQRLERTP